MAWAIEYLGALIVSVYVDMRMYSVISADVNLLATHFCLLNLLQILINYAV